MSPFIYRFNLKKKYLFILNICKEQLNVGSGIWGQDETIELNVPHLGRALIWILKRLTTYKTDFT